MNQDIVLGKTLALYQEVLRLKDRQKNLKILKRDYKEEYELKFIENELKVVGNRYGRIKQYLKKNYPNLIATLKKEEKLIHLKMNKIDKNQALSLIDEIKTNLNQTQSQTSNNPITQYYYDKKSKESFFKNNIEKFKTINKVLEYYSIKKIQYNLTPRKLYNMYNYLNGVSHSLQKAVK